MLAVPVISGTGDYNPMAPFIIRFRTTKTKTPRKIIFLNSSSTIVLLEEFKKYKT